MAAPLKLLILEDREDDAELLVHELRRAGYAPDWTRVDNESDFLAALRPNLDVILADFRLPDFDALRALTILQKQNLDVPLIVVTGALGDETAVDCINRGAADYLLKDRLARLGQAVATVVNERRLREEKLQSTEIMLNTERKYRSIFENAEEGIFQTDAEGRFLVANPTGARILGYDSPGDLTATLVDRQNRFHVDPGRRAELMAILEDQGFVRGFETRVYRKDGSIIWVSISVRAIHRKSGRLSHYESTLQDITQRKEGEQQIRAQANLLNLASDAIVVRDMDEAIRFWNDSAERLYGLSAEDVIGKNLTSRIYTDKLAVFSAREQLLKTGDWHGELRLPARMGSERTVDSRWTLVRDEHNNPKSILVIDTDITERKELEKQALRSQRMESIGTLASGIAHDLNNILTPILASTALLRANPSQEKFERTINAIENSAFRGAEIVKQVLTFARGAEGERKPLEAEPMIREVEEIARNTFPKSITIKTQLPSGLWSLLGDTTQIEQMLVNLCINARDAMPGGGDLTISAQNIEITDDATRFNIEVEPGSYLQITVRDTGSGIPDEIADKIFDPFFTTKQAGQGTGLGLSSLLGILKGHKGGIRVESAPGRGSAFHLYLPALSARGSSPVLRAMDRVEIGEGGLILVVDDEPSVREITQTILEAAGYDVIVKSNGEEALLVFRERQKEITAVVTDLLMPSMDGSELIRMILDMAPATRVMAFSGLIDKNTDASRMRGVKAFIQKPFRAEDLLDALETTLN